MATESKRARRFSPALVVSIAALFAALSGAAMALPGQNTVNSGDIIDQKVKARDLKTASVKADEIGEGIQPRTNSVVVDGNTANNGHYIVESTTSSCAPGEELVSGSASWNNSPNEELFVQEVILDHTNEEVTAAGGNDTAADRTLFVVAHCLQS
jgi:hypothetical protein